MVTSGNMLHSALLEVVCMGLIVKGVFSKRQNRVLLRVTLLKIANVLCLAALSTLRSFRNPTMLHTGSQRTWPHTVTKCLFVNEKHPSGFLLRLSRSMSAKTSNHGHAPLKLRMQKIKVSISAYTAAAIACLVINVRIKVLSCTYYYAYEIYCDSAAAALMLQRASGYLSSVHKECMLL